MSVYSKPNMGSGSRCQVNGLNGNQYEIIDGGSELTVINLITGRPMRGNKDKSHTMRLGYGRYGHIKPTNNQLRQLVRNQTSPSDANVNDDLNISCEVVTSPPISEIPPKIYVDEENGVERYVEFDIKITNDVDEEE